MTEQKVIIGTDQENKDFPLDIAKLIETRLLCQANSGGGKSWLLRKILEESHKLVQQFIIDSEGEFVSLREKYDYIIVGKGGDIEIDLKIASILPKKLIQTGMSTIIDISELKKHERILFVKRFLEALMSLPKKYWKPLIVVLDESHQFSPEKGKAESSPAVIDLMTRGRKRGYAGSLATQRLSKLSKDASAECNNVLMGRTGQDIDMKRASDILGFGNKADMLALRTLNPGVFHAFGPAFPDGITKVTIGNVRTKHPKVGSKDINYAPKPTSNVQKIIDQLKDIQTEAAKELVETADFKNEIKTLRTQLTIAKKSVDVGAIEKVAMTKGFNQGFKEGKNSISTVEVEKIDPVMMRDLSKAHKLIGQHLEAKMKPSTH